MTEQVLTPVVPTPIVLNDVVVDARFTFNLMTLYQHLQAVEVNFGYTDLPIVVCQMIVPLPPVKEAEYTEKELRAYFFLQTPARSWFEEQDRVLKGQTNLLQTLPAMFKNLAPIAPLSRKVEWYEIANVGEPELVNGSWVRPQIFTDLRTEETFDRLKAAFIAHVADLRYQHETSGVSLFGSMIKTDRESQATITGAWVKAKEDPTTTINWKAENGFTVLDAPTIIAAGDAVFGHVQACFTKEASLLEAAERATAVEDLAALNLETGWGE